MISDAMFFIPEQFDDVNWQQAIEGECLNISRKSSKAHGPALEKIPSPSAEKTSTGSHIHKSRWSSDEDSKLAEAAVSYTHLTLPTTERV